MIWKAATWRPVNLLLIQPKKMRGETKTKTYEAFDWAYDKTDSQLLVLYSDGLFNGKKQYHSWNL